MNKNIKDTKNTSLYIHFPWCETKCPYCDFNSHPLKNNYSISQDLYLEKLLSDLDSDLDLFKNPKSLHSIFIGGGTPTLISDKILANLLNSIAKKVNISDIEITCEANPNSFIGRAKFLKSIGITRVSIGCQSFDDKKLASLGRLHSGNLARAALDEAISAGLDVNADIIYALPSQSIADAISDLQIALRYPIHHLSWYQLTIEKGTAFAKKIPPNIPSEDINFEMMQEGLSLLKANSFHRYEISAFAKERHQCQHNLNYWKFGDYIGIGAGASGKLTTANGILRTKKPESPSSYLKNIPSLEKIEKTTDKDLLIFEILLNGLRLTDGFDVRIFDEFGLPLPDKKLEKYFKQDFLSLQNNILKPTDKGILWVNEMLMDIL